LDVFDRINGYATSTLQGVMARVSPTAFMRGILLTQIGHEHRGMVVTVYLDRGNPTWSTAALLNQLENGEFGVFYGP